MNPLFTLIRNAKKRVDAQNPFICERIYVLNIRNWRTRTVPNENNALPPHQIHDAEWVALCANLGRTVKNPKRSGELITFSGDDLRQLRDLIESEIYLVKH